MATIESVLNELGGPFWTPATKTVSIPSLKQSFAVLDDEEVIGGYCDKKNGDGRTGLLFTSKAMYWSDGSTMEEGAFLTISTWFKKKFWGEEASSRNGAIKPRGRVSYKELSQSNASYDKRVKIKDEALFFFTKVQGSLEPWEYLIIKVKYIKPMSLEAFEKIWESMKEQASTLPKESSEEKSEYDDQLEEFYAFVGVDESDRGGIFQLPFRQLFDHSYLDTKKLQWSWAGFFLGFIYLAYRKLYLEALAYIVVGLLVSWIYSPLVLVLMVVTGIITKPLYLRKFNKVLLEAKMKTQDRELQLAYLAQKGGVNILLAILQALVGLAIIVGGILLIVYII